MSSIIQNSLNAALGDGARSTKFECMVNFPRAVSTEEEVVMLGKSASFPGLTARPIELKYRGHTIPIKGQVNYGNTLSVTFLLTENHKLKLDLYNWMHMMDPNNIIDAGYNLKPKQYRQLIQVAQLNFNNDTITMIYNIENAFPQSISTTEVDYADVGRITEMTVEFAFSHFSMEIPKNGKFNLADEVLAFIKGGINKTMDWVTDSISEMFNSAIDSVTSWAAGIIGFGDSPIFDTSNGSAMVACNTGYLRSDGATSRGIGDFGDLYDTGKQKEAKGRTRNIVWD